MEENPPRRGHTRALTRGRPERDAREVQPRFKLRRLIAVFLAIGFACLSPRSGKAASPPVGTAFGAAESVPKLVLSTPERDGSISAVPGTVRERPIWLDFGWMGQWLEIHRFDFDPTLITAPIAIDQVRPKLVGIVELRL